MIKPKMKNKFTLAVWGLTCLAISIAVSFDARGASFTPSSVVVMDTEGKVDRRIYTEISRGPEKAPVVVLLNGLIYEIDRWAPVADQLADHALTVVRLSFSPQPESLRLMMDTETQSFMTRGLELPSLADDVKRVLDHHGIKSAATIVGLSYGAAVASEFAKIHPAQTKNLLLLSPLVVPLDNYEPSAAPLRSMLDGIRFWESAPCLAYGWINPWLCSSSEFWYDSFYNYFYENFLNLRVAKIPAGVDAKLYKKSIFQLVRAVRNFDLKAEVAKLKNVHLVIADEDDSRLKVDQLKVWSLVPTRERRSLATVTGVVHALPDEAPHTTAEWIENVARDARDLQNGEEYLVEGR